MLSFFKNQVILWIKCYQVIKRSILLLMLVQTLYSDFSLFSIPSLGLSCLWLYLVAHIRWILYILRTYNFVASPTYQVINLILTYKVNYYKTSLYLKKNCQLLKKSNSLLNRHLLPSFSSIIRVILRFIIIDALHKNILSFIKRF